MNRIGAALAVLFALAGCGDDSAVAPDGAQPTFVRPEYFDVTRSPALAFLERDDTTLVFARLADVADPASGTVIVGVDDGGYIGRVRSARRAGTRLLVRVDPARAADVVMAGTIDTSLHLGLDGIDLAGAVLFDGPAGENRLVVRIARGRISYRPLIDFGCTIAAGGVSAATARARGEYAFDVEASVEAAGPVSLDEEVVVAAASRDVVMRIGAFPVAARVTLRYVATVRIEGDFSPATSWASAASGTLAFGASRRGGEWRWAGDDGIVFDSTLVALPEAREAVAAIAVWPELAIECYGERTIETRCAVVPEYRAARGAASVIEWEKLGSVNGRFSFSPGRLAALPGGIETARRDRTVRLEAGPYKTDRYIFVREWGGGDGAFEYPKGIAVDAEGFVYVVDNWSARVSKFEADGTPVTEWGGPGTGDGLFDAPERIAIDPAGFVYVTDSGNHRVQRFTSDGQHLSSWGSEGTGDGQFLHPLGVASGGGHVFVTDNLAHRAQRFSLEGEYLSRWGSQGSSPGAFDGPAGCAVAPAGEGRLYVADCRNNRVQAFALTGVFETAWGRAGTSGGEFDCPIDVAVDAAGNVYVCDLGNDRFQVFSPDGAFVAAVGSRGAGEGRFDHPEGIAVDAAGNVYVVDGRNRRVQVFAPLAP